MLADIVSGEIDLADVLFLVAAIIFAVAAIAIYVRQPPGNHDPVPALVPLGLTVLTVAFWVL